MSSPISCIQSCSLCIRMSNCKKFETDYIIGQSMLHIGISNSKSVIFHFDERGKHVDEPMIWNDRSICIPIEFEIEKMEIYDIVLERYFYAFNSRYHPLHRNCYDFVVGFLNEWGFEGRTDHSKERVVENYIKNAVQRLEEYLISNNFQSRVNRICDICQNGILTNASYYHCTECKDFDLCSRCFKSDPFVETNEHSKTHTLKKS